MGCPERLLKPREVEDGVASPFIGSPSPLPLEVGRLSGAKESFGQPLAEQGWPQTRREVDLGEKV